MDSEGRSQDQYSISVVRCPWRLRRTAKRFNRTAQAFGRPVIYQPDPEFDDLPESHRWRHVQFDLSREIDFTWEREWRIQADQLSFDSSIAQVILPDYEWVKRLRRDHERDQDFTVLQYSIIMDQKLAEMYREEFPWLVHYRED